MDKSLGSSNWYTAAHVTDGLSNRSMQIDRYCMKKSRINFSFHIDRGFTPALARTYEAITKAGKNFEIIFCSGDHDENSFKVSFLQKLIESKLASLLFFIFSHINLNLEINKCYCIKPVIVASFSSPYEASELIMQIK